VELGLERLAMHTFVVTMDSMQPQCITLKSRLVMERQKAHISSQYLCGTFRPDTPHNINEVFITEGNDAIQRL
jgi:hypothetical protein